MRLLIAYDGSEASDAAIHDLVRAGLPAVGEALVISVSENWMVTNNRDKEKRDPYIEELVRESREKAQQALIETRNSSKRASARVKAALPKWKVRWEASFGSPAWEILDKAFDLKPDLIVVGSHGHTAIGRFVLGSISQKVLTEAHCSVRVARPVSDSDAAVERVIVGFDCSDGAKEAVKAVARRCWAKNTEVSLVAVTDPVSPSFVGQFIPPVKRAVHEINRSENEWIKRQARNSLRILRTAGLSASLRMAAGDPRHVLPREAEAWGAGCIFVGATAHVGRVGRFLLGSTAAAVAARAHCSVEIVRS